MKKFLITDGAGLVGSHLAEELIKRGNSIIISDDLNIGKMENLKKINFVQGDIISLKNIFKGKDEIFSRFFRFSPRSTFYPILKNHFRI